MSIKRNASAQWNGSGKSGHGTLSTDSTVLSETAYSFNTRFGDEIGTNPEELLAAAHAGCFSMKLAFVLQGQDFTATQINTNATVVLDNGAITEVHLHTRAVVPDMTEEQFLAAATEAKENCPVSKLFNASIFLDAGLE
jgi:lipoyl-dependent peroxiredoxin